MGITTTVFGKTTGGEEVAAFTLTGAGGLVAKLAAYGARVLELHVPDRAGKPENILLNLPTLEDYFAPSECFLGCTVGRVANRIAGGRFTLDGKDYRTPQNDKENTLHGGPAGWDKQVWAATTAETPIGPSVSFTHTSPDGDAGFPGTVRAKVIYTLTNDNALKIDFIANTDAPTPVNMTNHMYFNLRGAGKGDVLGHELIIASDRYTPVNEALIPTGKIVSVHGTPLDFTTPMLIGSRIAAAGGYDHNFDLRNVAGTLVRAARVREPESGRVMEVLTTQPGIQFYSGNFLNGTLKGPGGAYQKHYGFCLETQHFPDTVNQPAFGSITLRPGTQYHHQALYRFPPK
jgi:aldose 1-epimerase